MPVEWSDMPLAEFQGRLPTVRELVAVLSAVDQDMPVTVIESVDIGLGAAWVANVNGEETVVLCAW